MMRLRGHWNEHELAGDLHSKDFLSWGMVRDSKANPKMQADSNGRESGKYPAESYNQRLRHGTLTAVFHCDYCRHVYPLPCDSLALYGTRNNGLEPLVICNL
jgi:hypothetical protein